MRVSELSGGGAMKDNNYEKPVNCLPLLVPKLWRENGTCQGSTNHLVSKNNFERRHFHFQDNPHHFNQQCATGGRRDSEG